MKFILALAVGRIIKFIGSFSGRSTNLPGKFALKICPNFLKTMKFKSKIIAVTGSNGKTTTSNLIAHILKDNGYDVASNLEGANLTTGVASTMLSHCDYKGFVKADFVVLEVDERYSPLIFKNFSPDYFIVTNLVRDQVVRNGHPDVIFDKINSGITENVCMILNANDPISQNLAINNKRIYYGMEKNAQSLDTSVFISNDAKVCPKCFSSLNYEYYHYNHIGKFACSSCEYKTPTIDYLAHDIDLETGNFKINEKTLNVKYKTSFNFLNTTSAFAVCKELGLKDEDIEKSIANFEVPSDRFDVFTVGDRKATSILTKQNSVSLDQSISYTLAQEGKKTVVLYVNNIFYTENKDVSWLYDVTIERLLGNVENIVCLGERAFDVAVRFTCAGFKLEDLKIQKSLENLQETLSETSGDIYLLTASAFGGDDEILEVLKKWK